MPDIAHWGVFLSATVILLLMPGPSVLFVVARGIDQGFRVALISSLGLALGDLFQVFCAACGLSALLASSVQLFAIVKYAGAAYLIYLGLRRILQRDTNEFVASPQPGSSREIRFRSLVLQGFSVNALNPKTALFFLALLPQFIDSRRGPAWFQTLALGGAFVALGFGTNALYGRLGGRLGTFASRSLGFRKASRYVGGGTLVTLGVAAALTPAHATAPAAK
jgi:threonine/homoserine/homoserine lactone efflux protein